MPGPDPDPRPAGELRAELADLDRHLAEVPPHAPGPVREQLQARRDALQRALTGSDHA